MPQILPILAIALAVCLAVDGFRLARPHLRIRAPTRRHVNHYMDLPESLPDGTTLPSNYEHPLYSTKPEPEPEYVLDWEIPPYPEPEEEEPLPVWADIPLDNITHIPGDQMLLDPYWKRIERSGIYRKVTDAEIEQTMRQLGKFPHMPLPPAPCLSPCSH